MIYAPIDRDYPSSFGCEQKDPHPRKREVQDMHSHADVFIRLVDKTWTVYVGKRVLAVADEPGLAWHNAWRNSNRPKKIKGGGMMVPAAVRIAQRTVPVPVEKPPVVHEVPQPTLPRDELRYAYGDWDVK